MSGNSSPRGAQVDKELKELGPENRLEDQPIPLFADQSFAAGELEVSWYAHCLVAPVSKQAHDSFRLHDMPPVLQ